MWRDASRLVSHGLSVDGDRMLQTIAQWRMDAANVDKSRGGGLYQGNGQYQCMSYGKPVDKKVCDMWVSNK
eukprot:1388519-Rhodomonas_salina.1